jgi:hypothetical protein
VLDPDVGITIRTMTGTMPTEYMGSLIAAFHSCCWVGPAGCGCSLDAQTLLVLLVLRTRDDWRVGAMRLQVAGAGLPHLLRGNSCAIPRTACMTSALHRETP